MRKLIFLVLVTGLSVNLVFSQTDERLASPKDQKSMFDLSYDRSPTRLKSAAAFESGKLLSSHMWEYALMNGGYFTLGTNYGVTGKSIDDRCQLTFGHPFSMTSFAYPVIDGQRYLPYDLAANALPEVRSDGDTLSMTLSTEQDLEITTSLYQDFNEGLYLSYSIINRGTSSHQVGMGLLFDAALGRWGDGYIELEDGMLDSTLTIDGGLTDSLLIWERKTSPRGLGLLIDFEQNMPGQIVLGNWHNEYFEEEGIKKLYDLAVHPKWPEKELQPGDTLHFKVKFSLLLPDFGDQPFMRWDMPNALSIENQMLFPVQIVSNVEIQPGPETVGVFTLKVPGGDNVYGWESDGGIELNTEEGPTYQQALINIPEIYDSLVVPFSIQLLEGGIVMDELTKPVFIPAAPFSNEGLDVVIDTGFVQNQKVYFSFKSFKESTQQILYDLHKNNVFVYDNEERITDYTLGRDTTGGMNNADIIFVLDVTGSMGNEIAAVRENIVEFTDSLSYRGIDFRLGMVTFLDIIENVYEFTDDVQQFQMNVAAQFAHGGGDRAENSLDALSVASQFDFREDANRIIIWITDADYHISDEITQQTKEVVVNQLLSEGIQVHCIGTQMFQTDFYDQITMNTGGSYFDINGNFRDILLEVSRLNQSTNHLLSFYRAEPVDHNDVFKIEVHFAGLGGYSTMSFGAEQKATTGYSETRLQVFPNPLSYQSKISLEGPMENSYDIRLYNMNGQLMGFKEIRPQSEKVVLDLKSVVRSSDLNISQLYLLKISTLSPKGVMLDQKTIKIANFK